MNNGTQCASTAEWHRWNAKGRERREARRGSGNHLCSYGPSKGSWAPFLSDMAKVHEPVEQAANVEPSRKLSHPKGGSTRTGLRKQAECFDVAPEAVN